MANDNLDPRACFGINRTSDSNLMHNSNSPSPATGLTVVPTAFPKSPTAGIQETLDSLPAHGGAVVIPPGRHTIRRSIVVPANVTLRGSGNATVLQRPAPVWFDLSGPAPAQPVEVPLANVNGLTPGDELYLADAGQGGWHARHLVVTRLEGNRVIGELVAGDPDRSYNPATRAWAGNFFPMILIHHRENVTVADLSIDGGPHDYSESRQAGFTCSAVHGVHSENLRVQNVNVRRWPSDGISAQKGSAVVSHCVVEDCLGHGYHPGSSISCSTWSHNISRRNRRDGFFFCARVRNAVVAGNIFSDNLGHGVGNLSLPDAFNVVDGNVIQRNGKHGIEGFEALGNVIANNIIRDNSQSAPGQYAGIRLESHSDNSLTGNLCLDTQETPTQTTGIELVDPAGENVMAHNHGSVVRKEIAMETPEAIIRRTPQAPLLDGGVQDAVWKTAEGLTLAKRVEDGAPLEVVSTVRILHDDAFLYFGVECPEPEMDQVEDQLSGRGDHAFTENCVEIYLIPGVGGDDFVHLAVNSLGAFFQRGKDRPKTWDSEAKLASQRGADSWSFEIAVPVGVLGPEGLTSGHRFKANFYRTRLTTSPPERSCWTPTRASFLMPRRFGELRVE